MIILWKTDTIYYIWKLFTYYIEFINGGGEMPITVETLYKGINMTLLALTLTSMVAFVFSATKSRSTNSEVSKF